VLFGFAQDRNQVTFSKTLNDAQQHSHAARTRRATSAIQAGAQTRVADASRDAITKFRSVIVRALRLNSGRVHEIGDFAASRPTPSGFPRAMHAAARNGA
jgi:hypothetical protein